MKRHFAGRPTIEAKTLSPLADLDEHPEIEQLATDSVKVKILHETYGEIFEAAMQCLRVGVLHEFEMNSIQGDKLSKLITLIENVYDGTHK